MLPIQFIRQHSDVIMPVKGTIGAACFDLFSYSMSIDERGYTVSTGLSIALPENHVMLLLPRSGLSTKYGLTLRNNVGVIDEDYRGELILKFSPGDFTHEETIRKSLQYGNRVAQALVLPVPRTFWQEVKQLPETERGGNGFGSTGVDR